MKLDKAATFEQLDKMLQQSEYAYSQENRMNDMSGQFPRFHYFATSVNMGVADIPVKLQVRDAIRNNGLSESRYYTHNFKDIKKETLLPVKPSKPTTT